VVSQECSDAAQPALGRAPHEACERRASHLQMKTTCARMGHRRSAVSKLHSLGLAH